VEVTRTTLTVATAEPFVRTGPTSSRRS
jgi:hypothetical protein